MFRTFTPQDGMTFLMVASKYGSESLATLVLTRNADVNQQNEMRPVREVTFSIVPTHIVTYIV